MVSSLPERKGNPMPTPKAIFVGPAQIGQFFVNKRPNWNFVAIVDTIQELWDGLSAQTIDDDVQIIITLDSFFDPEGKDFALEQLVAAMTPYCFFAIISYHPAYQDQIRQRVSIESATIGQGDIRELYFIDPQKPNSSLDRALDNYLYNSDNTEVVAILSGQDPELVNDVQTTTPTSMEPVHTQQPPKYDWEDEPDENYLGQVVAVTSSKGGSGKSTVALTLGTYLAHASSNAVAEGLEERPLKIVILDLDVRDGQIGFLTGHLKPTVLHMRSSGIALDTLQETVIHSDRLKLDLLLAPKRPRLSMDTPAEFYLELIQFLKRHYDYVILDTSVNYLDPLLEKVAYPLADQIIFVSDIVVHSVFSMTRWIQEVTKSKAEQGMGISKKKIGIVVNKAMDNINMSGDRIARSALGLPVVTVIPNNAKLLAHAANLQSMETVLKHPDLRDAVRRLARAVIGKRYRLSENIN